MKTRFAPSPTGFIHIGNARTALLSALAGYHAQGTFLLRIEDTDKARSTLEFLDALVEDLFWLGILWQEGEGVGGKEGPYRQSERNTIYEHYYQELLKHKHAYPCYCTDEELELTRKLQIASSQPPRYAGTCRNLTIAQREQKEKEGSKPSLRFAMPKGKAIEFNDLVKGSQKFLSDDIGDFVIRKQDGSSSFMFCNAIDDSLMGVTEVIRGEDHLTNTPRQLIILEVLKLRAPQYGHISLINGMDGAPLSKRNGSRSIRELRDIGFLPLALVNYLARLGHYYESNDLMSMSDLAKNFSISHLGKSAGKYDEMQLKHWQKQAVLVADDKVLWAWLDQGLQDLVVASQKELVLKIIRESALFPDEAKHLVRTLLGEPEFNSDAQKIIKDAGAPFFEEVIRCVNVSGDDFNAVNKHLAERFGLKGKALFQPLRVALTGELHGPQMSDVFKLLGVDLLLTRLQVAKALN
jgi:nondiscriminating glutamyl-tRNA synthetase